jgi:hypothetical protein
MPITLLNISGSGNFTLINSTNSGNFTLAVSGSAF